MTLDMIQQNSQSLVEVSQNFSRLERERQLLVKQIQEAKQKGSKSKISILTRKISIIDKKMDEIRVFLLKILTNLHKLLEEEQNDIQHTTSIK